MAVPANPKLSDVCTEFLAPATTPLSAFLKGGAWVPDSAPNAGVPSALPIRLQQLVGAVRYATLEGGSTPALVENHFIDPEPAPPSVILSGDTTAHASGGTGGPYTYAWAYLSGAVEISGVGASNVAYKQWQATVPKSGGYNATWRCTISDGVSTVHVDVTIDFTYDSDA